MTIGELEIDYNKRTVSRAGERIHLTPIEYKILVLLSQNAGKVLTHDFIIREVWGVYTDESHTLRVNMANIRRKIEANPGAPKYILTEMGVGYRMVEEPVENKRFYSMIERRQNWISAIGGRNRQPFAYPNRIGAITEV